MSYDEAYNKSKDYFGSQPEAIIKNYVNLIDPTTPVLDIGAGQGRNSIFLAQNNIKVYAIDPSIVAVNTINEAAKKNSLDIIAIKTDFDNFVPEKFPYSAICVFGLLQLLSWEEIYHLIDKINVWLGLNGLLFIAAFSVDDFAFDIYKKSWS